MNKKKVEKYSGLTDKGSMVSNRQVILAGAIVRDE